MKIWSVKSTAYYRGWLGQHRPCCNTKTRPSFLNTWPSFLNSRPSFSFSLKASKARSSVWKSRPRVCVKTRPMLSQPAMVAYSPKSWLTFLIYILPTALPSQFVASVTYAKYLKSWFNSQYLKKKKRQRKKEISKLKRDIWSSVRSSGLLLGVWRLPSQIFKNS